MVGTSSFVNGGVICHATRKHVHYATQAPQFQRVNQSVGCYI